MGRHRVVVVGMLLALSLATSLAFLWPDLDAVAAEPTDVKKARPTLNPRPAGWSFADTSVARSAVRAKAPGSGRTRSAAATQTIINQNWDQVTELPAGWRTYDDNGITIGGEIMWGILPNSCWTHSPSHAVWATANGQNGEQDCQKEYPNVTDSWLVYGPFSLANATSAALSVQYYLDTEPDVDWLQLAVSLDGGSTYNALLNAPLSGQIGAGELSGQLPPALIGQPSIYLAFVFHSDTSVSVAGGGAYVDDVVLTAEVAGGGEAPTATPTPTRTPTATPVGTTPGGRSNAIYLPSAARDAAGPTVTPTPPAGGSCQNLVVNGGFQQATTSSATGWTIAGNVEYITGVDGHSTPNNVLFAYSGPDAGANGDLWQTVAVPSGPTSGTLSFWFKSLAGSGTPIKLQVDVLDEAGANVLLHVDTVTQGTSDWQQVSRTLSAAQLAPLAGRNVRLRFREADITGPLDLFFDDVTWSVCR